MLAYYSGKAFFMSDTADKKSKVNQAIDRLKSAFNDMFGDDEPEQKEVELEEGKFKYSGEELVGAEVFDMEDKPLADGEYTMKDGKKFTVKDGKIEKMADEGGDDEKFLDTSLADGTMIRVEGETLETGQRVVIVAEDGSTTDAPDGTHELADGRSIVVEAGMITEIIEAEEEMSAEVKAAIDDLKDKISKLSKDNKELKAEVKAEKEAREKSDKFTKEVFKAIELLADLPSDDDPAQKKSPKREIKNSRVMKLRDQLRKINQTEE